MNERDRELLAWVRAFNPYDLYSKSPVRADRKALEPYYRELVSEFFPEPLRF
jgi:inositol oxygenase